MPCCAEHDAVWSCRWEANAGNPALSDLYINTMDALDAIDNSAIYFIEGTGQVGLAFAHTTTRVAGICSYFPFPSRL